MTVLFLNQISNIGLSNAIPITIISDIKEIHTTTENENAIKR